MALLEVRGLVFQVGDRRILDGVDLAVAEGELHALIGANGTGKSTLAFLIMGCEGYAPTRGEIIFDGTVINPLPVHERARLGITLAWQEPARFEGITVRDYLTLGKATTDPGAHLARVGLSPEAYLDRLMDRTLSGGQRKRIELAAVLALGPRLALLDEPGSGIDLLSIQAITEVVQGFREQGGAVLQITHQEELARIADTASHLCDGRVVATGPPAEVLARYKTRGGARGEVQACPR